MFAFLIAHQPMQKLIIKYSMHYGIESNPIGFLLK